MDVNVLSSMNETISSKFEVFALPESPHLPNRKCDNI